MEISIVEESLTYQSGIFHTTMEISERTCLYEALPLLLYIAANLCSVDLVLDCIVMLC